jgi:hypothetical protein
VDDYTEKDAMPSPPPAPPAKTPPETEDEVVIDFRAPQTSSKLHSPAEGPTGSETSGSARESDLSSACVFSSHLVNRIHSI